jgi:hypothetical protein
MFALPALQLLVNSADHMFTIVLSTYPQRHKRTKNSSSLENAVLFGKKQSAGAFVSGGLYFRSEIHVCWSNLILHSSLPQSPCVELALQNLFCIVSYHLAYACGKY